MAIPLAFVWPWIAGAGYVIVAIMWLIPDRRIETTLAEEFGPLFEIAEKVYLVTQVSVAGLRNSNRFVQTWFVGESARKLEVVLNRYAHRTGEIDEKSIATALTIAMLSSVSAISCTNERSILILSNGKDRR